MATRIPRIEAPLISAHQLRTDPVHWLDQQPGARLEAYALNKVEGLEALRAVVKEAWDANPGHSLLHTVAWAFDHGADLAQLLFSSGTPAGAISKNVLARELGALRPAAVVLLPGVAVSRRENPDVHADDALDKATAAFKVYVRRVFPHLADADILVQVTEARSLTAFRTGTLSVGITWKKSQT